MRITRDLLMKLARNTVAERVSQHRRLVCIYLTGSLLNEEPLIGGTTDIDLFIVHEDDPPVPREIVRLTDEIHLDIAHLSQAVYHQPRRLRLDPWLGSFVCENPLVLHEIPHWFEFTQASVCAHFYRPETMLERARPLAEKARQLWMELFTGTHQPGPFTVQTYLQCIHLSANAVACLSGVPLVERRFLILFPGRAQAVGRPGLASGLVDLFTSPAVNDESWQHWETGWKSSLTGVSTLSNCPPHLHQARISYHLNGAFALWSEVPAAALWILLKTWTSAACFLPTDSPDLQSWLRCCEDLNLSPEHIPARLAALDAFLDGVEETLDQYASQNGISPEQ
jgi:hypothetical protein